MVSGALGTAAYGPACRDDYRPVPIRFGAAPSGLASPVWGWRARSPIWYINRRVVLERPARTA